MSSPQQITANQQNAQKSTGPTSDAGRATVSKNAITHGRCERIVSGCSTSLGPGICVLDFVAELPRSVANAG